jgi:hypothetical protein
MSSIKAQTVCTRDQGVLTTIKSMNGKATEFDLFHVHIAQDVVTAIGHYPILNL